MVVVESWPKRFPSDIPFGAPLGAHLARKNECLWPALQRLVPVAVETFNMCVLRHPNILFKCSRRKEQSSTTFTALDYFLSFDNIENKIFQSFSRFQNSTFFLYLGLILDRKALFSLANKKRGLVDSLIVLYICSSSLCLLLHIDTIYTNMWINSNSKYF